MTETDTLIDEKLDDLVDRSLDDGGDHDRYSHYVRKNKIMPSAIDGTPVIALCGKKWVPNRDPEKFTICPECKEIFEALK